MSHIYIFMFTNQLNKSKMLNYQTLISITKVLLVIIPTLLIVAFVTKASKNSALPLIFISSRVYIHKWLYKYMYLNMPQLIPFFFLNQVVFNFLFLVLIVYMFTKYILPKFVRLFILRFHVNSL